MWACYGTNFIHLERRNIRATRISSDLYKFACYHTLSALSESNKTTFVSSSQEPSDKYNGEEKYVQDVTFVALLKHCAEKKDLGKGIRIHAEILKRKLLERNHVIGSTLISMYTKCGIFSQAHQVFEELLIRDIVTWNALIAGHAQQGQGQEALKCFEMMLNEGLLPDSITFICILKACGNTRDIHKGIQIHEEIIGKGLLEKDVVLGTSLVDMYAKCGLLEKARKVLEELPIRNIVSWNALIDGYTQQGRCHEALDCYERMQSEGLFPTAVTFICMLKAFGSKGDVDRGKQIHEDIVSRGLLEKDIVLGTALVDMYAKCGRPAKAEEVLQKLVVRNVVSWSALISGYAEQDQGNDALRCFELMEQEGHCPNMVTYICTLKACGSTGAIEKAKQIHHEIISRGLLVKEVVLGTSLVDFYAKCGMLAEAKKVLEDLHVRNIVSWSALIGGYAQRGQGNEALNCFDQMQRECLSPDAVTFICILKACGNTGAIEKGTQVHHTIITRGFLENDIVLGTALVDMYGKCGVLAKAHQVLEELPSRNVSTWNALIAGYSQEGEGQEAWKCFKQLQTEGLCPDDITFLGVLTACSHSGLLYEAQTLFHVMSREYGISPNLEHNTCMVMVFGYAGYFDKAISVIKVMPLTDSPDVWLALLGACRKWGNVKLGRLSFDQVIQSDNSCSAAYVLMANIFMSCSMQKEAEKLEYMRLKYAAAQNSVMEA